MNLLTVKTAVFTQLMYTADCLCHTVQMVGIETEWELHTLTVINSLCREGV